MAKVQQSPQMPNIHFEIETKDDIESNTLAQQTSQNQTSVEVSSVQSTLPKKRNTTQYLRNTNLQVSKVAVNQRRIDDKVKATQNQTDKPIPGLAQSILGLIFNTTVFGVGIWWAIDFGLNWGGGVGLIWFVYLLFGIPAVILGTSLTLRGLSKLRKDDRFSKLISLPIASLLAFLGTAIIVYLIVTA